MAYVQLQDSADLTEEQILDHLKQEVGERAAIPKEIIILEQMPLTPVGKIFKPALRWEAAGRIYETELEALGDMITSVKVTVKEDKVHGALAAINVKQAPGASDAEIREKVGEILSRYTVAYRLEVA